MATSAPTAFALDPAVVEELRLLAADPGAYPLRRLALVLDGRTTGIASAAAGRRARELRAATVDDGCSHCGDPAGHCVSCGACRDGAGGHWSHCGTR